MVGPACRARRFEVANADARPGGARRRQGGRRAARLERRFERRRRGLRSEIEAFVDEYHGVALQLDLGALLADMVAILREHGLALPPDLAMMIKAFIALEGMGRQLDPDFDIAGEGAPFLREVLLAHLAPRAIARRGWEALAGGSADARRPAPGHRPPAPRGAAARCSSRWTCRPSKAFGDQLDRAASRLTMAIVTAALIVGSSIVMTVDRGGGVATLGLLGFVGAVVYGLWVLVSVWQGGRR